MSRLFRLMGIARLMRLVLVGCHDLAHWGLHPLSPYTNRAVVRRNAWENPQWRR